MQLIQQNPSHWYRHNGTCFEPFYEVVARDGWMRKTTLADARKVKGVVPSVTNVLSIINKPGLEAWKTEQAILAALTLPRQTDEPLDLFVKRVIEDMDAQSEKARTFGTEIHKAIEAELTTPKASCPEHLERFMAPVRQWLKENVEDIHAAEIIVGDKAIGVAGKLDLDCTLKGVGRTICDFKSQTIRNASPAWYPEWPLQLSAYRYCRLGELPRKPVDRYSSPTDFYFHIASVIIDSVTPGNIHIKVWDDTPWPNGGTYFDMFRNACALWRYLKNYDPRA